MLSDDRREGRQRPIQIALMALSLACFAVSPGTAQVQPRAAAAQPSTAYEADARLADELMRAGNFREAAAAAARAAGLAEKIHGADHVKTAVALHNLGFMLRRDNRPKDAQQVLERALDIYERQLPAVHEDTRNVVGELGEIYVKSGRGKDLADIYDRLVARAEGEGFGRHIGVAQMLANQGFVLRGLKRAEDSETAFTRALSIFDANGQIDSEAYVITLEALLERLEKTKRIEHAEARAKATIGALDRLGAKGATNAVILNNRQSGKVLDAGRSSEAREFAQAAIRLLETQKVTLPAGRADPMISALNNLARADRGLANYQGAEQAYRRAIALLEKAGDKVNAGIVTDNLAVLFVIQGRLDEAERHHKRGFALLEEALGREHQTVGRAAANLGALLNEAGRPDEAEPLLRRALAIADKGQNKDPVSIGIIEDNLAGLLRITGRRTEARPHYERAIALFVSALPKVHPRIATARNNFGRFLLDLGKYAEAEAELKTALALSQEIYGTDSFQTAVPAGNLAEVYTAMQRYDEARTLFTRALAALEAVYGQNHPNTQIMLSSAAKLELADRKPAEARAYYERAVAIELQKRSRAGIRAAGGGSQFEARRAFHGLIDALWQDGVASRTHEAARALEIAQWDSATPAAIALAALGARAGASDPALGALTRERQDLAAEWVAVDKRLTKHLAEGGQRNEAAEHQSRARLTAIDARLEVIDGELATGFPRYLELARPAPLSIEGIRKLLGPNEAAVQLTVTDDVTHVFAVTGQEVRWYRAPIRATQLRTLVRNLRCGLDRAEWSVDDGKRCATLLGIDVSAAPGPQDPLPFDLTGAYNLYAILLQPIADTLTGKDLLIVASQSLTALPLQVLLTEPPPLNGKPATIDDTVTIGPQTRLSEIAWLGRRHAITVLPSLASLAPLRRLAKSSAGRMPYIGIGNPLLTGPDGSDRRAFEVPACRIEPPGKQVAALSARSSSAMRKATAPAGSLVRSSTGGGLDAVRRQWPLPETADELCRVAGFAQATANDVVIGAEATETRIKQLSAGGRLADARIVHFATHGLLAGETAQFLADKVEPSLMLTPPDAASEIDDGLLTASEVASLKLDADWVVLSACNTASGDDVGAEALSGLARAFFYAGARSLLVSHWAVDSDATVKLITAAFDAMAKEPGLGQGRALAQAMSALIDGGGRDAHPANWAPFIVVGGSAASRPERRATSPPVERAAAAVAGEPANTPAPAPVTQDTTSSTAALPVATKVEPPAATETGNPAVTPLLPTLPAEPDGSSRAASPVETGSTGQASTPAGGPSGIAAAKPAAKPVPPKKPTPSARPPRKTREAESDAASDGEPDWRSSTFRN